MKRYRDSLRALTLGLSLVPALIAGALTSLPAHASPVPAASPPTAAAPLGAPRPAGVIRLTAIAAAAARALDVQRAATLAALATTVVRPGDTLSAIASARCGSADDWTGIYDASRAAGTIGADPNLVYPGQHVILHCTHPGFASNGVAQVADVMRPRHVTVHSVTVHHATAHHAHYQCGDGDGDGMDLPCSDLHKAAPVVVSHHSSSGGSSGNGSGGCSDPSGTLSDAQVAMVWNCAGGPSWADQAAITISMCESGHNTFAQNPSGATGLFQILGAVVPGNLDDAHVNALNAVSKFTASGDNWSQWVCKP
jgi:hypothetical protein